MIGVTEDTSESEDTCPTIKDYWWVFIVAFVGLALIAFVSIVALKLWISHDTLSPKKNIAKKGAILNLKNREELDDVEMNTQDKKKMEAYRPNSKQMEVRLPSPNELNLDVQYGRSKKARPAKKEKGDNSRPHSKGSKQNAKRVSNGNNQQQQQVQQQQ